MRKPKLFNNPARDLAYPHAERMRLRRVTQRARTRSIPWPSEGRHRIMLLIARANPVNFHGEPRR